MFRTFEVYPNWNPKGDTANVTLNLRHVSIVDRFRFEGQLVGFDKEGTVITMIGGQQFLCADPYETVARGLDPALAH